MGNRPNTHEAKLGCVVTQTAWDEEGYHIRDPDSTTYTGAIETAEEFELPPQHQVLGFCHRRGGIGWNASIHVQIAAGQALVKVRGPGGVRHTDINMIRRGRLRPTGHR